MLNVQNYEIVKKEFSFKKKKPNERKKHLGKNEPSHIIKIIVEMKIENKKRGQQSMDVDFCTEHPKINR